jgi:hypothetical protein
MSLVKLPSLAPAWIFLFVSPAAGAQAPPPGWSAAGNMPGARFGSSVALAGDVDGDGYGDAVVGARGYGTGGAAFAFLGGPSGLGGSPAWTALGGQSGMAFGVAASGGGDFDADGFDDVAIGANNWTQGQTAEGAVFVYLGSSSGLGATHAWMAEGNKANGSFGFAVAVAGDVDADGFVDLLVGAPLYNSSNGAAFLYAGSPSGLSTSPAWEVQSATPTARYGGAVDSAGDLNDDGFADIVVGAQYYDGSISPSDDRGAAYVYLGSPTGPSPQHGWFYAGTQAGGGLGNAVAGVGDVDADGYDDLLVAAQRFDEPGKVDAGRVILFRGGPFGPASSPFWVGAGPQAGAFFGSSVAGVGLFDGNAFADFAVGSRYYDPAGGPSNAGAVFLFPGAASGPGTATTYLGNQPAAEFGFAVSSAGDVRAKGTSDLLIGAWLYDVNTIDEGLVVLYPAVGTCWVTPGSSHDNGLVKVSTAASTPVWVSVSPCSYEVSDASMTIVDADQGVPSGEDWDGIIDNYGGADVDILMDYDAAGSLILHGNTFNFNGRYGGLPWNVKLEVFGGLNTILYFHAGYLSLYGHALWGQWPTSSYPPVDPGEIDFYSPVHEVRPGESWFNGAVLVKSDITEWDYSVDPPVPVGTSAWIWPEYVSGKTHSTSVFIEDGTAPYPDPVYFSGLIEGIGKNDSVHIGNGNGYVYVKGHGGYVWMGWQTAVSITCLPATPTQPSEGVYVEGNFGYGSADRWWVGPDSGGSLCMCD